MYTVINNGAARDFRIGGLRYFLGRGERKRTDDRDFAEAMSEQRHVAVQGLDSIDDMTRDELKSYAKLREIPLARGDKKAEIQAKILAAGSQ